MAQKLDMEELRRKLLSFLAQKGPSSAAEAAHGLGISQPSFSRVVAAVRQDLLIIGRARSVRYAAYREVPGAGRAIPIYEIDEARNARKVAVLHATRVNGFFVESLSDDIQSRVFSDLPYFLDDLRPAGFLGRLIPRRHPELVLPEDIQLWTSNHSLEYLARYGWNLPGNLILGDEAFRLYVENTHAASVSIPMESRLERYTAMANDAINAGEPGSSAAGEQPKFIANVDGHGEVIVKFSPPLTSPVSRRIADLLVAEHIAHKTLLAHGHSSLESEVIEGDRMFLEMRRFDRTLEGGRRGTLSLASLDAEFVGSLRGWSRIAGTLVDDGHISTATFEEVRWLELFGQLIGNTDMHSGNLSFFVRGTRVLGVTPTYDMLPMMYAPQQSTILIKAFQIPTPGPMHAPIWSSAFAAAKEYWTSVSTETRISSEFRSIASENRKLLESFEDVGKLLPKVGHSTS